MKPTRLMLFFLIATAAPAAAIPVWINEIHYTNVGADIGEFVEIAGTAGTDLSGFSLVFYNGSGGGTYDSPIPLTGSIPNLQNGFGTISFPKSGLQNGDPDGLALYSTALGLIQFLSYEGAFTATSGVANGKTSTNIGVFEADSTPAGQSLQLIGNGNRYEDFTWSGPNTASAGGVNTNQTLSVPEGGSTFLLLTLSMLCLPLLQRFTRMDILERGDRCSAAQSEY